MPTKLLPGNRLLLLNSGGEYFPALVSAIEQAEHEIWLETYIFANDKTGQSVAKALAAAAQRGVVVRLLVDGYGARNFKADFAKTLEQAGVLALEYRPELGGGLKRYRLRRLHRKLVLIDHKLAFVGGINIIDDDNAPPELRPHYDYSVQIEGPVIADIYAAVRHMWEIVAWVSLKHRYRVPRRALPARHEAGDQSAAFLIRDNIRHRNDIANAYLEAIANARNQVLIANAYFLPGFRFRHALRAASARGVKVSVLLQGQSDHPLLHYATQALYGSLLHDGIRIFEYRRSFLHAKVAVVDAHWATVGSSNIDPFSLLLAKESNLVVSDVRFAAALRASLDQAMALGAVELQASDLQQLSLPSRLLHWCCYGLVRMLVGIAGYGAKHWEPESDTQIKTEQ